MSKTVAILGTNWGRIHIGAFRIAGAEVIALCGRDAAKTKAIAAQEGIALATTNVEEACAGADIVVVAGPDGLHREHVERALAAGRHVYCEKPLTRTAEDALELERRAAEARLRGIVCCTCFAYRHLAPVRALKEFATHREPARWLSASIRNSFAGMEGLNRATDGAIMGLSGDFGAASHVVDAATWLMGGEPVWVEASMMGRPAHSLALHIGLDTGGLISISHHAVPEPGIDGHWNIIGDSWEGCFAGGYNPTLGGWRIGPSKVYADGCWDVLSPRVEPAPGMNEPWFEAHIAAAQAFLRAVESKDPRHDGLADFRQGAMVQRIFAAAMESERGGGKVRI